jgi:hypothetical protein
LAALGTWAVTAGPAPLGVEFLGSRTVSPAKNCGGGRGWCSRPSRLSDAQGKAVQRVYSARTALLAHFFADYGFEYSDEEQDEEDVDVENQYYNSKGECPKAWLVVRSRARALNALLS